jgi:hypothetical protein
MVKLCFGAIINREYGSYLGLEKRGGWDSIEVVKNTSGVRWFESFQGCKCLEDDGWQAMVFEVEPVSPINFVIFDLRKNYE